MKTRNLLIALFMLIGSAAVAQTTLPASKTVLADAFAQATKENKKVILMFHASWCGWCKKMDASLNDPTCKKMFDDNYVVAHLDVMELPKDSLLQNPGALKVMEKYAGEKSGLPFWLVLDTKGNVLANSLMPKDGAAIGIPEDNVGCPATEKEVTFFDNILKSTSKLKAEEIATIHKRFLLNQPPPQPAKGTN